MYRFMAGALATALVGTSALAQDVELGQQIYDRECALCHQSDGTGMAPTFPALSGNENLGDLELIVTNIHQGQGNMPPFPELTPEEIAAVASYIRNSWGNDFGPVETEEVASLLEGIEVAEQVSIWAGVFTEEQAERGRDAYTGTCSSCHGRRLDGAADDPDQPSTPPLSRARFLREWDGRSLATLFEFTRTTMPAGNPGSMTEQQYIDIIAYMLTTSNAPAGEEELVPDPAGLAHIVIEEQ